MKTRSLSGWPLAIFTILILMCSSPAWAYTALGTYGVPGAGYPWFPQPTDVPVYVGNDLNTYMGGGDNSAVFKGALNKFNSMGSTHRYYYAGLTSVTTCTSSYSVLTLGGSTALCSGGNFALALTIPSTYVILGSSASVGAQNAAESQIMWGLSFVFGGSGVGDPLDALQTSQGGLMARPLVSQRLSSTANVIKNNATATTPRTLGASPFACVAVATIDAAVCVETHSMSRKIRMTRTSFTAPGPTTSTCTTATQVNCGNDIYTLPASYGWSLAQPHVAWDPSRTAFWVAVGNDVWTSTNTGLSWCARGSAGQYVRGLYYSSTLDSVIALSDGNSPGTVWNPETGTWMGTFGLRMITIAGTSVTACTNSPFFGFPGVFYDSTGTTSLDGQPEFSPADLDGDFRCDTSSGGTQQCTLIYTDGTRARNVRRIAFTPATSASSVKVRVQISETIPASGTLRQAATGALRMNCGATCSNVYVLNGDNPVTGLPLSYSKFSGSWTAWLDTQVPNQQSSLLYIQQGPEVVLRNADATNWMVTRRDVYEFF